MEEGFLFLCRNHQDILDGRLRMRHRQQILDHYCSTQADHITDDLGDVPFFRSNALVSKQRRLLYCPVGKIASTFLTRFLVAAMETNPVVSPYAISIEKALRMRRKHTGKSVLFTPLNRLVPAGWREKWFLESLTRVLFVRCPFKRLWSAYVDKLLLPNPSYWQSWGQASMNGSKASTAPDSRDSAKEPVRSECGQSVTFSQFISFVLSDLHRRDTHIRPVAWECSPCYVNYDVIGHVETLPSDVMHVTQLLRWNSSTLRGVRWEDEHAADTIRDGVRNVFDKWSSRIARCMSVTEAGRRLWRVSQLRGFIGESQQYPFTGRQAHTLAAAVMERALLEARSRSRGHEKQLRRQVNSAFLAAYTTVSAELKEKIRKLYRADFQMFGYDSLLHL